MKYEPLFPQKPLFQAQIRFTANNDVVSQFNIEHLTCTDQSFCHLDIFFIWFDLTRGVIMADNDVWPLPGDAGLIFQQCEQMRPSIWTLLVS